MAYYTVSVLPLIERYFLLFVIEDFEILYRGSVLMGIFDNHLWLKVFIDLGKLHVDLLGILGLFFFLIALTDGPFLCIINTFTNALLHVSR